MNQKNARFRELIDRPGIVVCAGVYDAISARIAEQSDFDVVYMTGNGSMASLYGLPDIGIATMSDMLMRAHQISNSVSVPMLCDCDNGYGNLNNVKFAVSEYEALGVSGVHIEDQGMPKKCGAMEGVKIIPAEEMAEKIKIATKARKDPNFVICARTDSNPVMGIDEVIRRCKLFAAAGADFIYPEMVRTKEELLKVAVAVDNAPILYDHLELDDGNLYSTKELESMGVKMVISPLSAMFAVCHTLKDFYQHYRQHGHTVDYLDKMVSIKEYEKMLGLDEHLQIRELLK